MFLAFVMLVSERGANDVPVSIQFPESVLFVVLNAARRIICARADISFLSQASRPRILADERHKCTLIPRAATRTRVGHHRAA